MVGDRIVQLLCRYHWSMTVQLLGLHRSQSQLSSVIVKGRLIQLQKRSSHFPVLSSHYYLSLDSSLPCSRSNGWRRFHSSLTTGEESPTFCFNNNVEGVPRSFGEQKNNSLVNESTAFGLTGNSRANLGDLANARRPPNLQKAKKRDGIHLVHSDVAGRIVKHLGNDITQKDVTVFEINPGPGILTKALLKERVHKLRILETDKNFLNMQMELQEIHGDRLEIMDCDFFKLPKLVFRDKVTFHNNVDNIFSGVQVKSWDEAHPPVIMFGIVPPNKECAFLRYLPIALSSSHILYSFGRVQMFLFISHKEYQYMIAKPDDGFSKYRGFSILFQLFFDMELLCKEPRHHFLPCPKKSSVKKAIYDLEHLYLVKITPKKDLFSLVAAPEQLQELYFFIKQNTFKRKSFVISKLEMWIPNCGVRLIRNGFTIFTRFGDLTPIEVLKLFQDFSSWPEYPMCSFKLAMRKLTDETNEMTSSDDDEVVGEEEEEEIDDI